VCVDLWKSRSWPEGFYSLRRIGHIQFVLLNGSFCESTPNLLIFPSVSCHNDDRMQRSFVLLGWHMLNFAPPACYLSLSPSISFCLSCSSAPLVCDLDLSSGLFCPVWQNHIHLSAIISHVCLYICENLISITLTLMMIMLPLICCIVCGSHVHIWSVL